MTSKEAVKLARLEFEKDFKDGEETNQWLTSIIEGLKQAEKALEVLEFFKKYFFIKISDTSTFDKFYYVLLKDKNSVDYIGLYVNKEEKDLLKEWLKKDE